MFDQGHFPGSVNQAKSRHYIQSRLGQVGTKTKNKKLSRRRDHVVWSKKNSIQITVLKPHFQELSRIDRWVVKTEITFIFEAQFIWTVDRGAESKSRGSWSRPGRRNCVEKQQSMAGETSEQAGDGKPGAWASADGDTTQGLSYESWSMGEDEPASRV